MAEVSITDSITIGETRPLAVIAGPCVIEGRQLCVDVAGRLKEVCADLELPYIFKSSFDKANRTSISSFRGPGIDEGLKVLQHVREELDVPVLTDIHWPEQAKPVAEVVDALQIPAFLCRQTDLLVAAAQTGLPVNIKKGQFMAPEDMGRAAEKVTSLGNERVMLCERGTCFGYHDLVVDMRGIVAMKRLGYPVIFDATHAVQRPAGRGCHSGGDRDLAPALAAGAVAIGADGVFLETHPHPEEALSDGATMLPAATMDALLERLKAIAAIAGRK
jgi:2-dehydro-3-deoxyphosphooctonate aldolase (KDO 8-P synthase)